MSGKLISGWLILLLLCPCLWAAEPVRAPLTMDGYRAELNRNADVLDAVEQQPRQGPAIAASLPDRWIVSDGSLKFEVSVEDLKTDLGIHSSESLSRARRRLARMSAEAAHYDRRDFEPDAARGRLHAILARREFREVHGPTWLDRLQQRALTWLLKVLERIFGSSSFPTVGRVVVWILVAAAVLVAAYMVYRVVRRKTEFLSIATGVVPVSAKGWNVWLAEAQAAADAQHWRDAIHLAYWAGISLLETQGLWRPDKARTPREYLRLLPATSPHQPALLALTRRFEVVWYGTQAADESAFSQTMQELENLGCR